MLSEISAVIIFGRSSAGVRAVITPITGPFTSGVNSIAVKSAAITPQAGRSSGSSQSGSVIATIATAASSQRLEALDDEHRADAPEQRARADRREEEAGDLRSRPQKLS